MTNLTLTELDFLQIRDNFKEYLRNQSRFQDYDFEGSNLSILLDLLSYNTTYMAWYANMVANEMFLDSAQMRNSVVSRAKAVGYVPYSARGAVATIDLKIIPNGTPEYIEVPRFTEFTTEVDDVSYTFSTDETLFIRPSGGNYIAENINIYEGDVLTYSWTYQESEEAQRFVIPNSGVDTSNMLVEVQTSDTDTTTYTFTQSNDLGELTGESQVYFLQENDNQTYELTFGNGSVGKALVYGNIITVTYRIVHGSAANYANVFTETNQISGYQGEQVIITTVNAAAGGGDIESIESIKFHAPKFYEAQNRAVTRQDYETILRTQYPLYVESVRVWGGENNVPPKYGYVFACIKPKDGLFLTDEIKYDIINNGLGKRNLVSVILDLVDPTYIELVLDITAHYRSFQTTSTSGQIISAISTVVNNYDENYLNQFDSNFRYSKLLSAIDNSSTSILNTDMSVKMRTLFSPALAQETYYEIQYGNAIARGDVANLEHTLYSTGFYINSELCYLEDNGLGTIYTYKVVDSVKIITEANTGTINYDSGTIILPAFAPETIVGDYLYITVVPEKQDITVTRNQLLTILPENVNISLVDESIR